MSMWAGEQAAIKHVAQFDIVHEGGFACDQLDGIHFAFGFANDAQVSGDASTGQGGNAASRGVFGLWRDIVTRTSAGGTALVRVGSAMLGVFERGTSGVPGLEVLA